jgi:hypothetical protein
MIAYFFPPEGSAGTYRPLRFVRHLAKMGWCTSVISVDPYRYERYDPELLALVPSETKVIRVRGWDLWQAIQAWRGQRLQERLSGGSVETIEQIRAVHHAPLRSRIREAVRTAEAWYYRPDMAASWIGPAVEATVKMCTRQRPNVIWATAGPVSSCVVAQRASRRTGVPYVLDFRDPWGLNYQEFEVRRPVWAKRMGRRTMYQLFEGAQAVVFLFDTVAECYRRAYPGTLDTAKIHIIPNGYEGALREFAAPDRGKCTILYAGTLSSYRYDTLLRALHQFKRSNPDRAAQLNLLFVGEGVEALADEAAILDLSNIITTAGPTSYAEINRLQREAHALLVLGRSPTFRGYELLAGAKLFDYLKAGLPIVGILPPDETKKTLLRVGVSTVANVDSASEIIAVLRQLLDAWSTQTLSSLVPNRATCEAYSAERQTAALVRALEGVPAAEPFVPGSVDIPSSLRGKLAMGNG